MRRASRPLLYLATTLVVGGLAALHARTIGGYELSGSSRLAWAGAYVALLCVAAYGVGLPDLPRTRRSALVSSVVAVVVGATGVSLVQLAVGSAVLPRFVVFWTGVTLVPVYTGLARLSAGGHDRQSGREQVVVVGEQAEVFTLLDDVARAPERPFTVAWALAPDQARGETADGTTLLEAAEGAHATVVVLSRAAQADEAIVEQAALLHERGVRVRTLSLFYDGWLGKLPAGELERMSLMFDIGEVHRQRYNRLKRVLDVALAVAGLPVLLTAVPVVALANRFGNRGPLFYRQTRVGKGGRPFQIVKFRTMRPGRGPSRWTVEGDSRITPVGGLLRRTHVDELPQLLNIIRGDLSVVGPRPEQPDYVDELGGKIAFYRLRHLVRPGLTGWAQVKYPYGASELDAVEKLQYEFFYLRHQSLALDLRIVGRTIRSVVGRGGR